MTNILILSCGSHNKIIEYFKETLGGEGIVFAADCSELAPALYVADDHFLVPTISEPEYIEYILSICRAHEVTAVLSLLDQEQGLLATHKEAFLAIGTTPIVGELEAVERCHDKYKLYTFLHDRQIPAVKSYRDRAHFQADLAAGVVQYPVVVKPVCGSASQPTHTVHSDGALDVLYTVRADWLIQPVVTGTEYGADVYVDVLTHQPVALFIKEKLVLRAGETDKAVSVHDEQLFAFVEHVVQATGLTGIVDVDVVQVGDQFFVSDINPRFGRDYPHAYACGVNMPRMLLDNLQGFPNATTIGQYEAGVVMMKYHEILLHTDQLVMQKQ